MCKKSVTAWTLFTKYVKYIHIFTYTFKKHLKYNINTKEKTWSPYFIFISIHFEIIHFSMGTIWKPNALKGWERSRSNLAYSSTFEEKCHFYKWAIFFWDFKLCFGINFHSVPFYCHYFNLKKILVCYGKSN